MISLDQNPKLFGRSEAIDSLADALRDGYLTVFIGAGVSKSATTAFPNWSRLVERCCLATSVSWDSAKAEHSNEYLRKQMVSVKEKLPSTSDYEALVKRALYEGIKTYDGLMTTDLLVALGSLAMSSVRGAARAIVTYNYDDVLEWYLDAHGFRTHVVARLPELNRRADVTVYHPHGFLPLMDDYPYSTVCSDEVVLDDTSYKRRATDANDPWNELQRTLLGSNLALFVGMSGDDPQVSSLCWRVYNEVARKSRILGFIFMQGAASDDDIHHLKNGLVPVYYDDHSKLPSLLLEVTRLAAKRTA